MEFSRPEYWSGQPFPSPGDLPNPGILYQLSHKGSPFYECLYPLRLNEGVSLQESKAESLGTEAGWSATRALVTNSTLYHPSRTLFHLPEPKEISKPKLLGFRNSGQTVKRTIQKNRLSERKRYLSWRLAVA